jgi:RNase H-fold protein (predicted Holliday junction resolvase)
MKYFLVTLSLLTQVFFALNSFAQDVNSMVLLSDNQLYRIEARGINKDVKVNLEACKIILWDERSSTNQAQIQLNGQTQSVTNTNINGVSSVTRW